MTTIYQTIREIEKLLQQMHIPCKRASNGTGYSLKISFQGFSYMINASRFTSVFYDTGVRIQMVQLGQNEVRGALKIELRETKPEEENEIIKRGINELESFFKQKSLQAIYKKGSYHWLEMVYKGVGHILTRYTKEDFFKELQKNETNLDKVSLSLDGFYYYKENKNDNPVLVLTGDEIEYRLPL